MHPLLLHFFIFWKYFPPSTPSISHTQEGASYKLRLLIKLNITQAPGERNYGAGMMIQLRDCSATPHPCGAAVAKAPASNLARRPSCRTRLVLCRGFDLRADRRRLAHDKFFDNGDG